MKGAILFVAATILCFQAILPCFATELATDEVATSPPTAAETSAILEPLSSASAKASTVPSFSNAASIEAGTADTKASLTFAGYLPQTVLGNYLHYEIGGDAPVSNKGSTDE